jgi:hypothetical protein
VRILFALSLAAAAGALATEPPKPAPPPAPEPQPGPRLNLKLDNPGRYAQEAPRESGEPLPTLGGDARAMPAVPTVPSTRPFPKDTERGEK